MPGMDQTGVLDTVKAAGLIFSDVLSFQEDVHWRDHLLY